MIYKPYEYQKTALDWVMDHERCALFLDMGLGKTVVTLTAIQRLIDDAEVGKVLIVAPKKVAESTWTAEADKWNHLSLAVSKVMGTEKQRIAALHEEADVYVIGRDSFVWLAGYYNGRLPFDMLVIDELTSFKTPKSKRFRAMRIVTPPVSAGGGSDRHTGTQRPHRSVGTDVLHRHGGTSWYKGDQVPRHLLRAIPLQRHRREVHHQERHGRGHP